MIDALYIIVAWYSVLTVVLCAWLRRATMLPTPQPQPEIRTFRPAPSSRSRRPARPTPPAA